MRWPDNSTLRIADPETHTLQADQIAAETFRAYWHLVRELCVEWEKKHART